MRVTMTVSALGLVLAAAVTISAQQTMTVSGAAGQAMQQAQQILGGVGTPFGGGPTKPMDAGTGMIVGRTVDGNTTDGLADAIVTLSLQGFAPVRMMTDGSGRFAFRDLPKGSFSVSATKPGYSDGAYGRLRPSGSAQTIDLADGQRLGDANFSLWKFGVIAGTVVDSSSEPVVGALIRVLKRSIVNGKRQLTLGATDTTDDRGMYRIGSLEPGEYVVALPIKQGSGIDGLNLKMMLGNLDLPSLPPPPGGGGNVAMAFAINVSSDGGGGGGGGGNMVFTSDGNTGATPAGMSDDGHLLWYQTQFYPASVSAARAMPVTINAGDEKLAIDFQLKPVRTVSVSGAVTGPDGPAQNLSLSMFPSEADDIVTPIETWNTSTNASGEFKFANVPPGDYTIRAVKTPRGAPAQGVRTVVNSGGDGMMMTQSIVRVSGGPAPPLPTDPTLWSETNVGVGSADITDVAIALHQGVRLAGHVEFAGSAERPTADQMSSISISLNAADDRTSGIASTARGRVESNGSFATMGVPVGRYLLRVGAPQNWSLRSATVGGRDITDLPIELRDGDIDNVVITFTDKPTNLSGSVTGANGGPDANAAVLIFPTDRNAWSSPTRSARRLRNVRVKKDGSFTTANLPSGDYFIVAVCDAATGDWDDPRNRSTRWHRSPRPFDWATARRRHKRSRHQKRRCAEATPS